LFFREALAATARLLDEELNILRNEVDPHGYIIGRA
jgi:hypothetical protein